MRIRKVAQPVYEVIRAFDPDRNPVTDLDPLDFVPILFKDLLLSGTSVAVTHIQDNEYGVTFTPPSTGQWYLSVTHPTNNPEGWDETYDVTTDGVPQIADVAGGVLSNPSNKLATDSSGHVGLSDAAITAAKFAANAITSGALDQTARDAITNALLDLAGAVDGVSVRKALQRLTAALCGKRSGGIYSPVFRSMDDQHDRVAATCDDLGDRTAVSYPS